MNFIKWIIVIVVCLGILGGLSYFKFTEIQQGIAEGEAYPEQSESVEEAFVSVSEYQESLMIIGELIAPQRLDLRNEIPGEITSINFSSGSDVVAGQILIQLDINIEEANLKAIKAEAVLAQQTFDRNQELYEKGLTDEERLDQARASLTSALAQIDVLEHTITKKTLRSPFNGRAGLHNFEVGQYLQSNTLITNLVGDMSTMWIDFQVPQFYRQLPLDTQLDVTMIGNELHSSLINATVIAENTILNTRNRSRLYRASISNPDGNFAANSMVNLRVPISDSQVLLRVPSVAIQNDPLGQFIYLIYEDESSMSLRAKREQVNIVLVEEGYALLALDTRLEEGDRIAAAGAFKLREGILVSIGEKQESAPVQNLQEQVAKEKAI